MKRITKKNPLGDYIIVDRNAQFHMSNYIDKLGQLEDIEDDLGIDLIILAKGMKNGIYVKQGEKILKKELKDIRYSKGLTVHYELNGKQYDKTGATMILYGDYNSQYCDFTNVYTYGRDWALTKEELENEKKL